MRRCQALRVGHVRYPGFGSTKSVDEAQPLYVNAPFGVMFVHNGNLTNWRELRDDLFNVDRRHINTNSDSEVLLNIFANELQQSTTGSVLDADAIFNAVASLHQRARGAYAVIALISSYGMVAFRDPYGIRPLCIGKMDTPDGVDWMIASESVALTGCGYSFVRDVEPGEAVFIDLDGNLVSRQCAETHSWFRVPLSMYFARPIPCSTAFLYTMLA